MLISTILLVLVSLLGEASAASGATVNFSCDRQSNKSPGFTTSPITFEIGSENVKCGDDGLEYRTTEMGTGWNRKVEKGEEVTWVRQDRAEFTLNLQKGMPVRKCRVCQVGESGCLLPEGVKTAPVGYGEYEFQFRRETSYMKPCYTAGDPVWLICGDGNDASGCKW